MFIARRTKETVERWGILTYLFCLCHFRCLCPASFHGPDCQQTKHSFHGNGYAWFRPIRPCFESSLSLEFITAVPDGLLLYSGPLSNPEPGNTENFIAIGNAATVCAKNCLLGMRGL